MHLKATLKRMESIEFILVVRGYILGECRALSGSPDKAMKCMTILHGDVGNALARYLQRLTFQDEQLLFGNIKVYSYNTKGIYRNRTN